MNITVNKELINSIKTLQNADLMVQLLQKFYGTRK